MKNNDITQLSVRSLLGDPADYIIPMYQRNYAWEESEITQLIQDIIDYMPSTADHPEKNYYIGTLVVFERKNYGSERIVYETIDGQQRFTTLSLLASYLKNESAIQFDWYKTVNLHFESRKHSTRTFDRIFAGSQGNDIAKSLDPEDTNAALISGYQLIKKLLPQKLRENKVDLEKFAEYLLEWVQIIRVKVPKDTDLNHYFEIMNNRGEQLEKHEILKSRLMETLNGIKDIEERKQSLNTLHAIWEACANMEKYVQLGFTREKRNLLFGEKDWGQFKPNDFDDVRQILGNEKQGNVTATLDSIITGFQPTQKGNDSEDEAPERFNTVINFPNFLLHILRIQLEEDIPLDDKRLIATFNDRLLKQSDAITEVQLFIFNLLKGKYLFDHYIIKREFLKGENAWSLKRYQWYEGNTNKSSGKGGYKNMFGYEDGHDNENRRILMLLATFHVSTPTLVYKHWLNAVLYYLFRKPEKMKITAKTYLEYLEKLAHSFVFDRFLSPNEGTDYYFIIYKNYSKPRNKREHFTDEHLREKLSFGNIENNLIFNYLDYLLWCDLEATDSRVRAYEFTFRSSVEHYYPQHPMPGYEILHDRPLNSFGNLCLISHSKNSRLSNLSPEAKKDYYKTNSIDSIKQYLMMKEAQWDEAAIEKHYREMKTILLNSLEG